MAAAAPGPRQPVKLRRSFSFDSFQVNSSKFHWARLLKNFEILKQKEARVRSGDYIDPKLVHSLLGRLNRAHHLLLSRPLQAKIVYWYFRKIFSSIFLVNYSSFKRAEMTLMAINGLPGDSFILLFCLRTRSSDTNKANQSIKRHSFVSLASRGGASVA